MNNEAWPIILYYLNVIILVIAFLFLVNKKMLKELIPVGLFIGIENYTVEILGLHYGFWKYPLDNPGYPEIIIISSLVYFPIIAMLFYQYITNSWKKNIMLIIGFVTANMIIEVITLKTTNIFVYKNGMSLMWALILYINAYILILLFRFFYRKTLIL